MQLKRYLKIVSIILFGCTLAAGLFFFLQDRAKQKEASTNALKVSNKLNKGLSLYNGKNIELAIDTFYAAWNESVHLNVKSIQPEIAYWIAKSNYEYFGYEEIDEINKFVKKARHNTPFGKKARLLLGKIYENEELYKTAEEHYIECMDDAKSSGDTTSFVELLAHTLALYEKDNDWISPIFLTLSNFENLNKYKFEGNFSATALFTSELYRYMIVDAEVSPGEPNAEKSQSFIDDYIRMEDSIEQRYRGRIARNGGLILKHAAFDTSSNTYNDTMLLQSIYLYKKALNYYSQEEFCKYELANTALGLANTYSLLDSISESSAILSSIDTVGLPLILRLKIANEKAENVLRQGNNMLANKYLKDADKISNEYYDLPEYMQSRIIRQKIRTKHLLKETINSSNIDPTSNSLIDLQSRALQFQRKHDLEKIKTNWPKISKLISKISSQVKPEPLPIEDNYADLAFKLIVTCLTLAGVGIYLFSIWSKIPSKIFNTTHSINDDIIAKYGDIIYIKKEQDTNKVWYHLKNGQKHFEYVSVEKLINGDSNRKKLPGNIFLRLQQSYIINMFEAQEVEKGNGGIKMTNGELVKVSPKRKDELVAYIKEKTNKTEYEHFMELLIVDINTKIADVESDFKRFWGKFKILKRSKIEESQKPQNNQPDF